jgi:hypothetical protein
MAPYSAVRPTRLRADAAAVQWAERTKDAHGRQRFTSGALAIALWALSSLPLIVAALLHPIAQQSLWMVVGTGSLLAAVAAGLFAVLWTVWPSYVAGKVAGVD